MTYRKTALSAAIVACLGFSAHVHAQDSAADQAAPQAEARASQADDTTDLEAIVVTGIRGAMEKSLDTKREADSRLEVVTAEDVGKLPAHNVADTLQRLPGVNISSSSSDEIMSTPRPLSASSLIKLWISPFAPTSMPRVGSSRISRRGLRHIQRASKTFC